MTKRDRSHVLTRVWTVHVILNPPPALPDTSKIPYVLPVEKRAWLSCISLKNKALIYSFGIKLSELW